MHDPEKVWVLSQNIIDAGRMKFYDVLNSINFDSKNLTQRGFVGKKSH